MLSGLTSGLLQAQASALSAAQERAAFRRQQSAWDQLGDLDLLFGCSAKPRKDAVNKVIWTDNAFEDLRAHIDKWVYD